MTKNTHKVPEVIFVNDVDRQADYLCFLAQELAHNKFDQRNFTVLPYLIPRQTQTVHFPDFNYPCKFLRAVKSASKSVGDKFPTALTDILKPQLTVPRLSSYDIKPFWTDLFKIDFFDFKIGKITVLITPYGPGSSFNFQSNGDIFLTFRADRNIADLPRSLISALVLRKNGRPGKSDDLYWKNRFYAQFLATDTILRKYCPALNLPTLSTRDRQASRQFINKLHFGSKKTLTLDFAKHLSPFEGAVFIELIKNPGKVLTHDEIARILWRDEADEKYSLWAQTKLMQKLRLKLEKHGGDSQKIKTAYGQGYILLFE